MEFALLFVSQIRVPLLLLLLLVGVSCKRQATEHAVLRSPSGKYELRSTVNREITDNAAFRCIVLHVRDVGSGRELMSRQTSISERVRWVAGWMPDEDVLVVESVDVGVRAYRPSESGTWIDTTVSPAVRERAAALLTEKFPPPGPRIVVPTSTTPSPDVEDEGGASVAQEWPPPPPFLPPLPPEDESVASDSTLAAPAFQSLRGRLRPNSGSAAAAPSVIAPRGAATSPAIAPVLVPVAPPPPAPEPAATP